MYKAVMHGGHGDMLGKAAKLKEKDRENPFIDRLGFQQVMESRLADFHRAVPEYQMQSEYFRSIL